jgi:hypothetical protein
MSKLLDAAEKTLPLETTLTENDLPSDFGFVVFEEPLTGIDARRPDSRLKIRAFMWALARVNDELGIHMAFYIDAENFENLTKAKYGASLAFVGCSEWFFNTPIDSFEAKHYEMYVNDERMHESMMEDRRRLATMLSLLHQPIVREDFAYPTRPEIRRAGRIAKEEVDLPTVRILTLREITNEPLHEIESSVEWTHRWIVNGHWRNQWYATEQRHRPIWIAPFQKGPADKPLVIRPTVRAWRR